MAKKQQDVVVNLLIKEAKIFVDFLKKFATIDQSVLLEFKNNSDGKTISIKSGTPSDTCIKVGDIPFVEVFKDSDDLPKSVKIGLYNFEKFIKILSLSKDSDIKFQLTYDINDKQECVAKSILLTNTIDEFELFIVCAPQTIFASLNKDLDTKLFNKKNVAFSFVMTTEFFKKFSDYINLDANDAFSILIKKKKLLFTGKTQTLPFPDEFTVEDDSVEVSIKKEFLKHLDNEVYEVSVKSNTIIFESNDSDIRLCISANDEQDESDGDIDDDDIFDDDDDDIFVDDDEDDE